MEPLGFQTYTIGSQSVLVESMPKMLKMFELSKYASNTLDYLIDGQDEISVQSQMFSSRKLKRGGHKWVQNEHRDDRSNSGKKKVRLRPNIIAKN